MALDKTSTYKIKAEVQGTGELDRFGRSIRNVSSEASKSEGSIAGFVGSISGQLQALGVAVGAGTLARFAKQALDAAGGLGELASQIGVSTDLLQALQYAGTQAGLSSEQLEAALARLTRTIGDAANGEKKAIDGFNALGVGVLDAGGKVRSTEDVLLDVARALAGINDPAQRAAAVVDLFGKAGQKMLPLLEGGEQGIRAFIAEAKNMGLILGEDAIGAADKAADKIAALEFRLKKLAESAAASIAGPLNGFLDWLDAFNKAEAERGEKVNRTISNILDPDAAQSAVKALEDQLAGMDAARENAKSLGFIGTVFGQTDAEFQADRKAVETALDEARKKLVAVQYVASLAFNPGRSFPGGIRPTTGTSNPPPKSTSTSTKQDPEAAALEALRQQVITAQKLSAEETVLAEIENGRYKTFSTATKEKLLMMAREIDLANAADEIKKEIADSEKDAAREAKKNADEQERIAKEVGKQLDGFRDRAAAIGLSAQETERLAFSNDLLNRGIVEGSASFQDFMGQFDEINAQIMAKQGDWSLGARAALLDYAAGAKDVAGMTKQAFENGFQGLEDALVRFTTTGKLSFRSFAQSVISDLARILIRTQTLGPLAGFLGDLFKGGFSGLFGRGLMADPNGAMLGRATGGNVTAGTPYIVGEKRPELFVPGRSGTIVPSTAGLGGSPTVNVSVVFNNGAAGPTQSEGEDAQQRTLGERIVSVVKGVIVDEMRPNGLLARAAT